MLAIAEFCAPGTFPHARQPTEGLAPVIIQQIGRTIAELRRSASTILLVEQNFRFARPSPTAFLMEHGRIIDAFANSSSGKMDMLHEALGV